MARSQQWAFLRAVRERGRWGIKDIAERIGVSREHLGRVENGHVDNPGWEMVERWADELGVSMRLVGFIRDHPAIDADAADYVARLVIGGYSEEQIIEEVVRRYGLDRP